MAFARSLKQRVLAAMFGGALLHLVPLMGPEAGKVRAMWCWTTESMKEQFGEYWENEAVEKCCEVKGQEYWCYQEGECAGYESQFGDELKDVNPRPWPADGDKKCSKQDPEPGSLPPKTTTTPEPTPAPTPEEDEARRRRGGKGKGGKGSGRRRGGKGGRRRRRKSTVAEAQE